MDKAEIAKLREFLRRSFGAPTLKVAPNSKSAEAADVSLGERKLGTITVDDEDGDRSFAFAMKFRSAVRCLQDYLRRLFENDKLTIAGRLKKSDSVELNNGPDFLGVISADDAEGSTFTLQMAILDVDLTTKNERSGSPRTRAANGERTVFAEIVGRKRAHELDRDPEVEVTHDLGLVEPTTTRAPSGGWKSTLSAAPDIEISIRLAVNSRPLASLSIVYRSRGVIRS